MPFILNLQIVAVPIFKPSWRECVHFASDKCILDIYFVYKPFDFEPIKWFQVLKHSAIPYMIWSFGSEVSAFSPEVVHASWNLNLPACILLRIMLNTASDKVGVNVTANMKSYRDYLHQNKENRIWFPLPVYLSKLVMGVYSLRIYFNEYCSIFRTCAYFIVHIGLLHLKPTFPLQWSTVLRKKSTVGVWFLSGLSQWTLSYGIPAPSVVDIKKKDCTDVWIMYDHEVEWQLYVAQ